MSSEVDEVSIASACSLHQVVNRCAFRVRGSDWKEWPGGVPLEVSIKQLSKIIGQLVPTGARDFFDACILRSLFIRSGSRVVQPRHIVLARVIFRLNENCERRIAI